MRSAFLFLPLLVFAVTCAASTPEDFAKLAQLKTGDAVMEQLLKSNPLQKPLSPSDVVYLKKNGVSERFI